MNKILEPIYSARFTVVHKLREINSDLHSPEFTESEKVGLKYWEAYYQGQLDILNNLLLGN